MPRDVIEVNAEQLPMHLYVRTRPGTLRNRGFLLATICDATSDVVTTWTGEIEGEVDLDAWLAPGYDDDPNTPCGITPLERRRDRIAIAPDGQPSATVHLAPGGHAIALVAQPPPP